MIRETLKKSYFTVSATVKKDAQIPHLAKTIRLFIFAEIVEIVDDVYKKLLL